MKKLFVLIFISTLLSVPSFAGGEDVRMLPEIKTFTKAKGIERAGTQMIQPIKENGGRGIMEKDRGLRQPYQKRATATAQPSHGRVEKIVERVVVREPEAKKKFPILFESNPAAADVVVNGLYVGSTPVQIPLTDGVYNVKIVLANHDVWEQQIKAFQGLRVLAMLQEGQ